MIFITQNQAVYEIKFKYDLEVIEKIKNVPGRCWVPDRKIWTIPRDKLGFLIKGFEGTRYENILQITSDEHINENAKLDTTTYIPNIDIKDVKFHVKEGAKPYKHQLDFMKYAIDRQNKGNTSGFMVCDDQGLAKTCESMNLALYNKEKYKYKHCLVICCINSSKYNWKQDIIDHTRGEYTPYILGDKIKRNGNIREGSSEDKLYDLETLTCYKKDEPLPYFIILNIEAIRFKQKLKSSKKGKKFDTHYSIADRIIELINNGEINMVIIDEVHKNMSPQSKQGEQILNIKAKTGNKALWLPMSGTPITNKPTDVYTPLKLVNGHNYKSFYSWCKFFCVAGDYGAMDIIGYKNIPTLKDMISYHMIRRLKDDVLDLPPKIRYDEYINNTQYQDKLYSVVLSNLKGMLSSIALSPNPLAQLMRLRQVNGSPEILDPELKVDTTYIQHNAKMQRLIELVDEIVDRGEKLIIFSNWVEPLRTIYRILSEKYKICSFTGTMTSQDRQKHKEVFMNNPEYKILLGTIGAAGTTHTFTASNNIIFYDEPWTPSDKQQAEDRIYRIGTTKSVNIYTLISRNTVDERVHDILYRKSTMSDLLVDNKLDLYKRPDLLDWILG
jgi:putative helicase